MFLGNAKPKQEMEKKKKKWLKFSLLELSLVYRYISLQRK